METSSQDPLINKSELKRVAKVPMESQDEGLKIHQNGSLQVQSRKPRS